MPLMVFVLVLLCLLTFALSNTWQGEVTYYGDYGDYGIPLLGGDPPPRRGHCAWVGVAQPDNPFSGWPVNYHPGDWNTITSWFCDPTYFKGYTHWGIDIGRLNWNESIYNKEAVVTAEDVVVMRASCCDRFNSGMGNNVMVQALDCETVNEALVGEDLDGNGVIEQDDIEICEETGWFAIYMHLLDVTVVAGDRLKRGDVIGHIDNTGNSTGDHLHYQINGPNGAVDPAPSMAASYDDALRDEWKGQR